MLGAVHAYRFTLDLDLGTEMEARAVEGALRPEVEAEDAGRVTSRITRDGRRVEVHVAARDASTLRAALNSYLRWVRAAAEVAGLAGDANGALHPKDS